MDDTTIGKLSINAANGYKMASNWVMATAGIVFAVYLGLPLDQQQTLLQHIPVPAWLLPIAASVVGIIARLIPQQSISPTVAEAKSTAA